MKTTSLLSVLFVLVAGTTFAAEPTAFNVKVSGHGRPMILIPGLACTGEVWNDTVAHFRDRYECHVLTLAGFGGTPARSGDAPVLATVREELAAYIRERHLDQPLVIGHSLGGFLALDLATHHPELPGRLVIVDSLPFIMGIMGPGATLADAKQMATATASSFAQMDRETYARMIRQGPNGSTMAAKDADLDRIIGWGTASDGATVGRAMTEMYTTDLRADLAKIKAPTLVLAAWVGYAPYSSHAFIEKTYGEQYAGLKGTKLEITDTARHFIMLDEPEWLHRQVENFLATPAAKPVSSGQ